MIKINIDELNEAELIDLNHRIVERLRFLSQMRAHSQMLDFKIGERVAFHPTGYPPLLGIVIRYNRKNGNRDQRCRTALERCSWFAAQCLANW
jgi:hypothetical protein